MPKQTFFNLPEDKRKRIIDLAVEEFAGKPYGKASLSNIVARAGIAKGSMYQYFEDKKDLYTYILELAAAEKLSFIQSQGVSPDAHFFTTFEQALLAGARFNLEHPQYGKIMSNAMEPSGEEVLQEITARLRSLAHQYMKKMLIDAQEKGTIRKDINPGLVAHLLNAMLSTGLTEYLLESLETNMRDLLADSKEAQRISVEQIHHIIGEVIKFLRNGLEGEV